MNRALDFRLIEKDNLINSICLMSIPILQD